MSVRPAARAPHGARSPDDTEALLAKPHARPFEMRVVRCRAGCESIWKAAHQAPARAMGLARGRLRALAAREQRVDAAQRRMAASSMYSSGRGMSRRPRRRRKRGCRAVSTSVCRALGALWKLGAAPSTASMQCASVRAAGCSGRYFRRLLLQHVDVHLGTGRVCGPVDHGGQACELLLQLFFGLKRRSMENHASRGRR